MLRKLWNDECGAILSAELVMVGTLAVIGLTVGLATVSEAVNEELQEVAMAIRSLDQSYCVEGRAGCRAWTAGSCYRQQDVEKSLSELQCDIHEHEDRFDEHPRRDDDDDRDDRRREADDDEYRDNRRGDRDDRELRIPRRQDPGL